MSAATHQSINMDRYQDLKKPKIKQVSLSYVYLLNNMVLIINMLERNLHGLKLTPLEIAV